MNTEYFNDISDLQLFPAKPKPQPKPKGMISISLNFVFYLLIYFFVFRGDVKFLSALILVMFIHEFGHFVFMRRFEYNDRKLFFIPFMNMFLTGEDRQASLKEMMLILFFGPLPGIVLGLVALFFGQQQQNQQLEVLGWIFLTWNVINLYPLDALDGGQISEFLFPRQHYVIQLVATCLVCLLVVAFAVLSKEFFLIVIPVFLGLKLNGVAKINGLRKKLEEKGIDWRVNFHEINNKQYWLIRKEILTLSKIPSMGDMANEYTESLYEGLIMQNIKGVLLNQPYNDLKKNGKSLYLILWISLFIIPLVAVFFYLSQQ